MYCNTIYTHAMQGNAMPCNRMKYIATYMYARRSVGVGMHAQMHACAYGMYLMFVVRAMYASYACYEWYKNRLAWYCMVCICLYLYLYVHLLFAFCMHTCCSNRSVVPPPVRCSVGPWHPGHDSGLRGFVAGVVKALPRLVNVNVDRGAPTMAVLLLAFL